MKGCDGCIYEGDEGVCDECIDNDFYMSQEDQDFQNWLSIYGSFDPCPENLDKDKNDK